LENNLLVPLFNISKLKTPLFQILVSYFSKKVANYNLFQTFANCLTFQLKW